MRAKGAGGRRLGKDPAIRRDLERGTGYRPGLEVGEGLVRQNAEAKIRGASFTAGHSHNAACVSHADTGLTYPDLPDHSVYFSHPTCPPLTYMYTCTRLYVGLYT